jgi:decaprenyl-phosphate phosphoribosyltransferase
MDQKDKNNGLLASINNYISIARPDHWFKNVFILPGLIVPFGFNRNLDLPSLWTFLAGVASICLIASSNYVINEVLDAASDKHHPEKRNRPIPSGQVKIPLAYAEWLLLMMAGLALACVVGSGYFWTMVALWGMGCVYNIPPVRSKDKPFLDVISEAVNNPLRFLAGWFIVVPAAATGLTGEPLEGASWFIVSPEIVPPISLIISYWAVGCYFMAIKRFAEYRVFECKLQALDYRKSFGYYTENKLLVSIMCYASVTMLFFGAFIARYRLEMVLSFPFIAVFMAIYLGMGLRPGSIVQTPEKLYKSKLLMATVSLCAGVMGITFLVDLDFVENIFKLSAP